MGEGKCCSGFGEQVCQFTASVIGDSLEAECTQEKRESERAQTSQKDSGWKNVCPWNEGHATNFFRVWEKSFVHYNLH